MKNTGTENYFEDNFRSLLRFFFGEEKIASDVEAKRNNNICLSIYRRYDYDYFAMELSITIYL